MTGLSLGVGGFSGRVTSSLITDARQDAFGLIGVRRMYGNSHQGAGPFGDGARDFREFGLPLASHLERRIGKNRQSDTSILAEDRGFGLGAEVERGHGRGNLGVKPG